MPYTPPSQQSPVASQPDTPPLSRSHSYFKNQKPTTITTTTLPASSPRPGLPRSSASTAYLHKHRRSPSVAKSTGSADGNTTPDVSPRNAESDGQGSFAPSGSLRQSPPPVNESAIPTGAVISPPDSAQSSSDEEENMKRGRVRELSNLAELQAAIRFIEQHRQSSPNRIQDALGKNGPLSLVVPSSQSKQSEGDVSPRPPLSKEARKISHSRSNTESSMTLDLSRRPADSPGRGSSDSDDADEEDVPQKPPMLRKKSGELVRPALRPSSARRRPSSMPGTPTYSKAVHFDAHLEHVRHFLQVDRPLAVSAGSSPVEQYEGEMEFPFGNDNAQNQEPPFEWEIKLPNFPRESAERVSMPIRVENVYLSSDNKKLIGNIAVANLAFHKLVVARFTLDYWKTTSEVVAEYANDVRRKQINDGYDRFNFSVKLEDQANLENKTMFFCVRYNVNGAEYWDNNKSMNFQVEFSKKLLPMNGKQGSLATRPLNALPRSRPSPPMSAPRPKSMPTSFDDFADGFDTRYEFDTFPQPGAAASSESPIRFKTPQPKDKIIPEAPSRRSNAPAQAFGNRYDFGASLSAAIQAASITLGDRSGFAAKDIPAPTAKQAVHSQKVAEANARDQNNALKKSPPQPSVTATPGEANPPKPAALTSEKPSLQSQSYHELLDKYCFVRSTGIGLGIQESAR